MAFGRVGINLSGTYLTSEEALAGNLESLGDAGPDFVEVCPHLLGVILGELHAARAEAVMEVLAGVGSSCGLSYTVHAPHRLDLMNLDELDLQRGMLEASVRFAGSIGAGVVVCHAGQRVGAREARHHLGAQLCAELEVLREVGEVAGELGVVIAVENSYPEPPVLHGTTYAPAAWPSELAAQVATVDHPAVGGCLDVGYAFVAASFFGFDYLAECEAVAPFVRHVHLHDNLGHPDPGGETRISERWAAGMGDLHLPPGRGTIPLEELFAWVSFPQNPTCCVELHPNLRSLEREALHGARQLSRLAPAGSRA